MRILLDTSYLYDLMEAQEENLRLLTADRRLASHPLAITLREDR